ARTDGASRDCFDRAHVRSPGVRSPKRRLYQKHFAPPGRRSPGLPGAVLHKKMCTAARFSTSLCRFSGRKTAFWPKIRPPRHNKESRMAKGKILKFDPAGPGLNKPEILKVCDSENVRFLRLQFTDILGVIKNVEIPRSQFEKALDGEIQFDGSSIEGFTRIEESDMNLV